MNKYLEKIAEQVGNYNLTDSQYAEYKKARSGNHAGLKIGLSALAGTPLLGPIGMAGGAYLMHKHQQNKALMKVLNTERSKAED